MLSTFYFLIVALRKRLEFTVVGDYINMMKTTFSGLIINKLFSKYKFTSNLREAF